MTVRGQRPPAVTTSTLNRNVCHGSTHTVGVLRRPITVKQFAAGLAGLDQRDFEAFVTELWRARGLEVDGGDPGDGILRVSGGKSSAGVAPRTLLVTTGGVLERITTRRSDEVDAVVTAEVDPADWRLPRVPRDVPVIDAADLREYTLFAVGGDEGTRLCQDYLNTEPIETVAGPDPTGSEVPTPGTDSDRWGSVTTGLAIALLVLAAVGGPLALGEFGQTTAPEPPGGRIAADDLGADTPEDTAAPVRETPDSNGSNRAILSVEDIRNADRLGRTHSALLTRPYRWELSYEAYRNGSLVANRTERLTVEGPYTFRGNLSGNATIDINPWMLDNGDVYADGTRYYQRRFVNGSPVFDSDRINPTSGLPPLIARAYGFIRIFMENATVIDVQTRNGTTFYIVGAGGDPVYDNIENVSTRAVVSPTQGIIAMRTNYENPYIPADRVEFTFAYRFEAVDLTAPPWFEAARNATQQGT